MSSEGVLNVTSVAGSSQFAKSQKKKDRKNKRLNRETLKAQTDEERRATNNAGRSLRSQEFATNGSLLGGRPGSTATLLG